jgi:hypothetical protein
MSNIIDADGKTIGGQARFQYRIRDSDQARVARQLIAMAGFSDLEAFTKHVILQELDNLADAWQRALAAAEARAHQLEAKGEGNAE